ncbi:pyruvate, phosphate dikinase [Pacificimonas sp. WHA3]|uniref:Pyruvate, phosphate dikinase n=1 Tax=Pacificimonas pallii TaxID=2827236 RepID=A0ABS6SC49_9SPHN|nr:pyruvate, phosphate dikinase [Pacificimonas pallii]MBV7255998.1 pyruvate, phosphate dikinase [Pacificimonas pallii]
MTNWVYRFGGGVSDGGKGDRNLLGGKGANLAEMASIGLPVPPGFTITTEMCTAFYDNGEEFPDTLGPEVEAGLKHIETITGKAFGAPEKPLLVSVRSGARASMPGMMDTVLNLGLNDETVAAMARESGDARFAWDSYRRFIQMYSDVVLGIDHYIFEDALEIAKEDKGVHLDTDLTADDWQALVATYKEKVEEELGRPFPQDPKDQLWGGIRAVFASWQTERAKIYRRLNDIPHEWGTAVNVQAMVFGNMGETSATGVAFTRDPSTGANAYYGEFLINAQGEDVVAGIRTPQYLTREARAAANAKSASMEEAMPDVYAELAATFARLESHYADMQDIEFTVEQGKLWLLQTRSGKRTAKAALKIAVDMVADGVISKEEAVRRVEPQALDQLLHPALDPDAPRDVLTVGLPASPGAASGVIAFTADEAERRASLGEDVLLVRVETSPEDIHGMHAAKGILTARGGMTSHAAVVARGMGRPCVSGAGALQIDRQARTLTVAGRSFAEGEQITIDGGTGEVMAGEVATVQPELSGDFGALMGWADEFRRMNVRTNAETPADCRAAREFGAEGIGLCRTEHMFFDSGRITSVRQMILAEDASGRREALAKLLPEQRSDFSEIFRIMAGLPVTIRLLDPPLHEFMPQRESDYDDVAAASGTSVDRLKRRATELHEFNPMLGHRGVRLGITYPEIYEMQARAIFEAALDVAAEGEAPLPEIMVPLVMGAPELARMRALIERVAAEVFAERGTDIAYLIGTMIELPRAALRAGDIAEHADFFSFGTNDLTQTTLGISRDDAARFLGEYVDKGLLPKDPFVSIDEAGVGELVELAAERGRATAPEIKLGICGEHGGDPASVHFCEGAGLAYVSCSPYRVPIARLAAAQAALAGA